MRKDSAQFLRRALLADGVVSGLSGLMLVVLSGPIAALLGVRSPGTVAVVGVALLVYAAALLSNARREMPQRGEAAIAVALNVAWVVVSLAVIAAGWLSVAGNWVVGLVADVVLIFAILQAVGLRRMASEAASRPA